jgi:hypothetical protein
VAVTVVARAERMRRRRVIRLVAVIALCALVYTTVVVLYALNSRTIADDCPDAAEDGEVLLSLTPDQVDATANRIQATLDVVDFGALADPDTGLLADPLELIMQGTDGERTISLDADSIPPSITLSLITEGVVESWPFDRHVTDFAMVGVSLPASGGTVVPLLLCGSPQVPGWTFSQTDRPDGAELDVAGISVAELGITAQRAPATIAFGIVLLALMLVLPVIALIVAIAVRRGRRRAEATLLSWIAAMLFATIPLRTFLPGSPPIGSWVDYLVVLWVVAGLIAALVVYVIGWMTWSAPGPAAEGHVEPETDVTADAAPAD